MERKLGRFPDDKDLSIGFTPGVRFFFKYNEIVKHPNAVFEGVLPLKIKNEVVFRTADGLTANAIPKGQEVLIVIGEGLEKERIEVRLKGKGGSPVYRCIFP